MGDDSPRFGCKMAVIENLIKGKDEYMYVRAAETRNSNGRMDRPISFKPSLFK